MLDKFFKKDRKSQPRMEIIPVSNERRDTEEEDELLTPEEPAAPASPSGASRVEPPISPGTPPPAPIKPRPSRGRRFVRSLLTLLILLGLGALAVIWWLYMPLRTQAQQTQADLAQAQQRISSLESQVADMVNLETDRQAMQDQLDQARLHVALLQARTDILGADLALAQEDDAKARLALSKTADTLRQMQTLLPTEQRSVADDMLSRLDLALSEIERDRFAARSDLNVLEKSLLELETAVIR